MLLVSPRLRSVLEASGRVKISCHRSSSGNNDCNQYYQSEVGPFKSTEKQHTLKIYQRQEASYNLRKGHSTETTNARR